MYNDYVATLLQLSTHDYTEDETNAMKMLLTYQKHLSNNSVVDYKLLKKFMRSLKPMQSAIITKVKTSVTLKAQSMCQPNTAIVLHLAHHKNLSIMFLLENGL